MQEVLRLLLLMYSSVHELSFRQFVVSALQHASQAWTHLPGILSFHAVFLFKHLSELRYYT